MVNVSHFSHHKEWKQHVRELPVSIKLIRNVVLKKATHSWNCSSLCCRFFDIIIHKVMFENFTKSLRCEVLHCSVDGALCGDPGWVLRWQRCGERWVEILQCGVTAEKKNQDQPTLFLSGFKVRHWLFYALVIDVTQFIGPPYCQSLLPRGVDVISSLNQGNLSILLLARVQIYERLLL